MAVACLLAAAAVHAQVPASEPVPAAQPIRATKIVLVGDPTTAVQDGWGGSFCAEHVTSFAACVDLARGGRSSGSYRAEGSWDLAMSEARAPGYVATWVLIEFGHNDQSAVAPSPPYTVAPDLFDPSRPDLGLHAAPGTRTFTIYSPGPTGDRFSNGVVLIPFRDRLYAQWQSSARDEDSLDTWVAYSVSADGVTWSPPKPLASAGRRGRMHSSGGWWTDGRRLVAYVNVWPEGFQSGAGGFAEYRLSSDGTRWTRPKRVLGHDGKPVDGIIEQDPHAFRGGVLTAFHLRPGIVVAPFTTNDPLGVRGWRRGAITLLPTDAPAANAPFEVRTSREIEPSFFLRGDCAVMVMRDQESTFRQLASESCDGGATWTTPALTDMPDSRAKQGAGNLPDGTAYLVNAPRGDRVRMPLAVTLSADGRRFDRAYLLRGESDLQPLRYEGKYKRPGYHYPKSVLWRGHLYVGYATNKEDVQLTRVPVASLVETAPASQPRP